jgi:hypothetical protein
MLKYILIRPDCEGRFVSATAQGGYKKNLGL